MSSRMHLVFQVLTGILHLINFFGGVVPPKYQPFVAFALAVVQGGLGLYNHYYNPDGTPASVAYIKPLILLALLLIPGLVFAQDAQQHFMAYGNAVSFMGPGGSAPASIAGGGVNITKSWLAGYQQITVPSLATFKLGVVDLNKPLPALLGKKLTAKLAFDATQWNVDFYAGAGKVNQGTLGVDRVAETAGVCATRKLTTNVSAQVVCGQWLHGGTVNGVLTSGIPTGATSSTAAVSSGLKVTF